LASERGRLSIDKKRWYRRFVSKAATKMGPSRGSPRRRMMTRLRGYFIAGVLVTAPIAITLYLAGLLLSFFDQQILPLVPPRYNPETYLPFFVPGIGLVATVVVMTLIGMATTGYVGRLMLQLSERALSRMPLVRSVYGTAKQIVETVISKKGPFTGVAIVEFPYRGSWTIGFITGASAQEVSETGGQPMINVLVFATPNPTSGFLLCLPERDVHRLSMSVEDGFKHLVSLGTVPPSMVGVAGARNDNVRQKDAM
jgi:uncharacterized membrane protein